MVGEARKSLSSATVEIRPWPLRHCCICNSRAPYLIRFGPFLAGRYCWRDLPVAKIEF